MPDGLRSAYLMVLGPPALIAPLPLFWTGGASPLAIALYEVALILLFLRARSGRPIRLSDAVLNGIGLSYFFWLAVETAMLKPGLLRSVSHLLLFTAIAKLASLKRPAEGRTALLVIFLLVLAAVSSSTHVASLIYCAAMAALAFRTLSRLAVLADFEQGPPARVLKAVPTAGLSAAAIVGGVLIGTPLFFLMPRLHGPFAFSPVRLDDSSGTAVAADRVDLDSFGGSKLSNRVILRLSVEPPVAFPELLRLREAVFTKYRNGIWTREPLADRHARGHMGVELVADDSYLPEHALARISVDQNVVGTGFLFLPYRSSHVHVERGRAVLLSDGAIQVSSSRPTVRYQVSVAKEEPRAGGESSIDPARVPPEIREYAWNLTQGLTDPREIADRIVEHFQSGFVYTLDPPRPTGEPLVNFLSRSKAGHCEYFASAAAMMLAARGVRARLVTGSYGGEVGAFSNVIVVRGANLHAWVEAELDGTGFQVVEPTPPSGVPPATSRVSWWKRLVTVGREIEFFYDRRIIGFDSGDQVQLTDALRDSVGGASRMMDFWRGRSKGVLPAPAKAVIVLLGLAILGLIAMRGVKLGPRVPLATRTYLGLRGLLARKQGALAATVPPEEVVRLFEKAVPAATEDVRAVVAAYCEGSFGGREPAPGAVRDLRTRWRRIKRAAGGRGQA